MRAIMKIKMKCRTHGCRATLGFIRFDFGHPVLETVRPIRIESDMTVYLARPPARSRRKPTDEPNRVVLDMAIDRFRCPDCKGITTIDGAALGAMKEYLA